jgi:chemotaxis protein CheD
MNRKIIAVQKLPTIFLKPGEVHFGRDPARVITVLGSCVSVIMYHRHTMIGAICHAVMPSRRGAGRKKSSSRDIFQYVDSSMAWMLDQFDQIRIRREDIEVKIFGGSEIFYNNIRYDGSMSIGRKNIEAAMKTIHEQNLKLKAWNVGGDKGRKVIFNTNTGEVFTKFVTKVEQGLTMTSSESDR